MLPAALCLSLPAQLLAYAFATDFQGELDGFPGDGEWMERLSTLEYLHLLVLPGLALLLVLTLGAALLSPEPLRARLGLVRPRGGWAPMPLYALAAPVAGVLGMLLATHLFEEPSLHLRTLSARILEPRGLTAGYVVLWLAAAPGVAEELLFRGFAQQRLQRSWPAPLAIALTSAAFALSHLDPMHAVGVLPVGLWLGFVAWGTRSVVPSMFCHAFYNAVMILAARSSPEEPWPVAFACLIGAGLVSLAAAVLILAPAGFRRP